MKRKGIFPYEYLDCINRRDETFLPDKNKFYSQLNGEDISDDEYKHAVNVWNKFNCKTLGEYMDIYLIQDTLLLDDIFQSFRRTSINKYKLVWYFSSPGLSWDALYKLTGAKTELITDGNIDMYHFIEKPIRGGISVISNKYAHANNKYLKDFDQNKPSSYNLHLDKSALYRWAMSQSMPFARDRWVSLAEFSKDTDYLTKDLSDSDHTYFVEVDVDYPENLHYLHNDYPFLPEKMIISDSMLSKEQLANRIGKPCVAEKLVPNFVK